MTSFNGNQQATLREIIVPVIKPARRSFVKQSAKILVIYSLCYLAVNHLQTTTQVNNNQLQQDANHQILWPQSFSSHIQQHVNSHSQQGKEKTALYKEDAANLETLPRRTHSSSLLSSVYLKSLSEILKRLFSNPQRNNGVVLFAEASTLPTENKDIMVLNSTNFNAELIQFEHPFPHIKLIEYYLLYCGICRKFKSTYIQLAKEIFPWRNVIRPSAIDLSIALNAPIASIWSIDTVPTLRIHPPPNEQQSVELHNKLMMSTSLYGQNDSEVSRAMFGSLNSSISMIDTLRVSKYIADAGNNVDRVTLLKSDLLNYIEKYVREYPKDLPKTWPNFSPVTESSLLDLRLKHPRQELFLLIETGSTVSDSDQSSSTANLGFRTVLELSSSAARMSIRYVKASKNRDFIDDVIVQLKKNPTNTEQVKILQSILDGTKDNSGELILVHVDSSHYGKEAKSSQQSPYMHIVTGSDLLAFEHSTSSSDTQQFAGGNNRARRATIDQTVRGPSRLGRQSPLASSPDENLNFDKLSTDRKVELVTRYIDQSYSETLEDKAFVKALRHLDEGSAHNEFKQGASKILLESGNQDIKSKDLYRSISNLLTGSNSSDLGDSWISDAKNDYNDKVEAIRFMLFQEIPRKSIADKSLSEQQEIVGTLLNLLTVIRQYFPLPDLASTQFIEGTHGYLSRQLLAINTAISTQDSNVGKTETNMNVGFDTRSFRRELKRLETEGKRLPEIRDWTYCRPDHGYSCALRRLFYTLTAFEYNKLSQISSPQPSMRLQAAQPQQQSPTNLQQDQPVSQSQSLSMDPQSMRDYNEQVSASNNNTAVLPSPVERVVSPPSTTAPLSLTIATPTSHLKGPSDSLSANTVSIADLPTPVLLVMRDYITNFYSVDEYFKHFRDEAADLNLKIIRQKPAEFSILWLWEAHNRINKRLSVEESETNLRERPKDWYPTFEQCAECYKKPPSFLNDPTVEPAAIFREAIEWNREKILQYLVCEYTKQPMSDGTNIFGYQVPYAFIYICVVTCIIFLIMLRCASVYIERQRRHKATLLNGNGVHYSPTLQ